MWAVSPGRRAPQWASGHPHRRSGRRCGGGTSSCRATCRPREKLVSTDFVAEYGGSRMSSTLGPRRRACPWGMTVPSPHCSTRLGGAAGSCPPARGAAGAPAGVGAEAVEWAPPPSSPRALGPGPATATDSSCVVGPRRGQGHRLAPVGRYVTEQARRASRVEGTRRGTKRGALVQRMLAEDSRARDKQRGEQGVAMGGGAHMWRRRILDGPCQDRACAGLAVRDLRVQSKRWVTEGCLPRGARALADSAPWALHRPCSSPK